MKTPWTKEELALPLFLIIVIAIAVSLAYVTRTWMEVQRPSPTPTVPTPRPKPDPAPSPSPDGSLDEATCTAARGHWNPCGSACRGAPPDSVCIQMCKPYCECGGIAGFGCPAGTTCGQYEPKGAADAMGICE